ncbi:MAG TPA: class I SAM-dependent methyltransferase [Gammaproteobacteria bacterium]|nr:class I SAM-dependent methyltransferase [Gammaproteobacteria bacterium]
MFHSRVTWLDRWLVKKMVDVVGNPPVRISLWDGREVTPPCDDPVAVLVYNDRGALLKTIIDPELHWGDLYCSGRVEFEGDMVEFMEVIYRGISGKGEPGLLRKLILWLGHRRIFNTMDKARENIHHHYDIGNDFYRLWLDTEEMQYTCAYFPEEDMTLEQAQVAKLHHICRKLQLKPGDTVVEAGCGWGGLARFMAKHYGVKVRAYNISKEQVKYARQRAEEEGLTEQIEYVLDDYRNISGQYDVFVSVGMLEHVGQRDYRQLGQIIKRCMKPEGRGLIHTIGRVAPGPMNAWIERRIFPGARPPSLCEMMDIFEPAELSVYDVENLRLHYSRTLLEWLQRFEAHSQEISEMMDEEFVKAWRLYLSGSTSAFNVGELQLYQVVFYHAANNNIPGTRRYLYDGVAPYTGKAKLTVVSKETDKIDA